MGGLRTVVVLFPEWVHPFDVVDGLVRDYDTGGVLELPSSFVGCAEDGDGVVREFSGECVVREFGSGDAKPVGNGFMLCGSGCGFDFIRELWSAGEGKGLEWWRDGGVQFSSGRIFLGLGGDDWRGFAGLAGRFMN